MKKVLLVNNDLHFTTMVKFILARENFAVKEARNGKEAMRALAESEYDLVISDMFIPFSNGPELLNSIRKDPRVSYTPVMIVSDVANEQSIANCVRLGADVFLVKPIDPVQFISQVKNLILQRNNVAA